MNKFFLPAVAAAALGCVMSAGLAHASESKCDVPVNQWQPRETLQKKLEADGYKVRQIKTENGCYEVYAISPEGKRMETYFNPKTLEALEGMKDED
jgi:hypothetical protein